jgi:hypothetical protein
MRLLDRFGHELKDDREDALLPDGPGAARASPSWLSRAWAATIWLDDPFDVKAVRTLRGWRCARTSPRASWLGISRTVSESLCRVGPEK